MKSPTSALATSSPLTVQILTLLCVLILLPGFSAAQPAEEWLAKMASFSERAPLSVAYEMSLDIEQAGSPMTTTIDAEMLLGSETTMRVNLSIAMNASAMGGALEMDGVVVLDGENMWVEMNNPMTGRQVIKTTIERMNDMSAQAGLPGMNGGFDPFEQIDTLTRWMTFEVESRASDLVRLVGTPTESFEEELGANAAMLGDRMVLELSTEGAPLRMTMGTENQPVLTMTFSDYDFLDAGSLASDAFVYTPPEGAQVITP